MRTLFYPESLALFGISDSPSNLARRILANLDRLGFRETVYLIGEKRGVVSGRPVCTSLDDVESAPDCAVLLIPAAGVAQRLEECGRKGVRNVVVESGGFSEFSEDRKALEGELARIAKKWQIRLVGPNCVGIINAENGLALPFYSIRTSEIRLGEASIISQSGGIMHDIMTLCAAEGVGINKLVSVGNKLMTDENDFLEYFISDPSTGMIGIYLETIVHGHRLMELAASTEKPIIVLKGNTQQGGSEIARFHTSSLANDDTVVDAAFRQSGIHRARNLEEMIDLFKIFKQPLLKGPRLAMIARSGGHAVLSVDAAARYGCDLAPLSDDFFDHVSRMKKGQIIRLTNPLDVGDIFDFHSYLSIIEKAVQEKDVDGVVFTHNYTVEDDRESTEWLIASANRLSIRYRKPVVTCMVSDKSCWFAMKELADPPIFTSADAVLGVLARSLDHYRRKTGDSVHPRHRRQNDGFLPVRSLMRQEEAFKLLRSYGVPVAECETVETFREGASAARRIGYPVALKMVSPAVLHKTEHGGVMLNIPDENALKNAFNSMQADEYLVQAMAGAGHEVIIGGKRGSGFGPVILFGLGGILVEVYRDVALRIAPIDEKTSEEMIREIKGAVMLAGFRGGVEADIQALSTCIASVSRLLAEHPEIVALDINPLIVFGIGEGLLAVDVKMQASDA